MHEGAPIVEACDYDHEQAVSKKQLTQIKSPDAWRNMICVRNLDFFEMPGNGGFLYLINLNLTSINIQVSCVDGVTTPLDRSGARQGPGRPS